MCFVWGIVQKSLQIQKPDSTKERKNIIKSFGNIKNAKHILNVIGLFNSLVVKSIPEPDRNFVAVRRLPKR